MFYIRCQFGEKTNSEKEILMVNSSNKKKNPMQSMRFFFVWSGKRGSNPRPSPWQGDALSTELFPREQFI